MPGGGQGKRDNADGKAKMLLTISKGYSEYSHNCDYFEVLIIKNS
jgi:hypothetical protein